MALIELDHIAKTYDLGLSQVPALRDINVSINAGEFVAIIGQSGSGKSTLMNIIGCLDTPSSGQFLLDGIDVRTLDESHIARVRNRRIGFVFQSFNLIPRTPAIVNVEMPLAYAGVRRRERRQLANAALAAVGLVDRADHLPTELSGGQQQRVALARALVTSPALILADEPTGNLDSGSTAEVMELFTRLNREGRTLVLITHEADVAAGASRIVRLRDGLVVSDKPSMPQSLTEPAVVP